jgi:hypothetical protein
MRWLRRIFRRDSKQGGVLAALKGDKTLTELVEQFEVHFANQITQWCQ